MISNKDIHLFEDRQRVLLHMNEFICLRPHPSLQAYISNYNITFPAKGLMSDNFTSMPCGCATISIEVGSKNLYVNLDGPITKPYIIGSQTSQLKMAVTIEFKPAGLFALTGISQNELADVSIPFDGVHTKLSRLIATAIEKAKSTRELVDNIDMLLIENMYTDLHPQLVYALKNIVGCAGNISVRKLSGDIHYSERQLNRICNQHLGMGAKSFSRIVRINKAFHLLKKPNTNIAFVSDVMGFHDLSHFVRDFRLVSGITPQEFRKNLSDFYINPTKF